MDPAEAWRRATTLPATVSALVGEVVFLALPSPWKTASVRRVEGWAPKKGDVLEAAGREDQRLAESGRRGFRVMLIKPQGALEPLWLGEPEEREQLVAGPLPRPAWLDALARHHLLARASLWVLGSSSYGLSPVALLMRKHAASVPSRGFLHYDRSWENDTDNPVRDLAAIVERPHMFQQLARLGELLTYEVAGHPELVTVRVEAGNLSGLVASMNSWLDEACAERRIYEWATGTDRLAFLGRSPAEVAALTADVPVGDLSRPRTRLADPRGPG